MSKSILWIIGGTIVLMAMVVSADTLLLKDGRELTGKYMSGSVSVIEFEVDGVINTYPLESIISLTFQRSVPSVSPKPASATTGPLTINAGTQLMVRNESNLVTGRIKKGDRFTTALEANLVVDGQVIAPKGSKVYGRVVEAKEGKRLSKAKLVLEVTDINIDGQMYPIVTDQINYDGERSGALKKIAAGAAVGAAMDKNKGARTGAKIGVAAAVLTPGNQISIPVRSLLSFRMTQPLQVNQ